MRPLRRLLPLLALLGLCSCGLAPSGEFLPSDTLPQAPTAARPSLSPSTFPAALFRGHGDLVYGTLATSPMDVPLEGWTANVPINAGEDIHGNAAPGTFPRLKRDVSVNPMAYTHLEVTMSAETGDHLMVWWDTPLHEESEPHASALILADGDPHTYLVPLEYGPQLPWRRPIDHLEFVPCNGPGAFTLHAMRFVAIPPEQPLRLTLDRRTMPTSRLTQFEISLPALPEGATFTAGLGTPGNPVRFQVIQEQDSEQRVLLDRVVEGVGWEMARVDLPATAGPSKLFLHQPSGYWGAPVIEVPTEGASAIPVILISNDTLRADHVSCYGYGRNTTPELDAFAQDAVLFENAFTPESFTLTAHMSMLTGLYPKNHGITENLNLREEVTTLPEALGTAHYFRGAFTGMEWWFTAWRGFAQGLDVLDVPHEYRPVFETYGLAEDWLDHVPGQRFFLFLHNYDLHSKLGQGLPYDPDDDRFRTFSATIPDPPDFPELATQEGGATLYLAGLNRSDTALSEQQQEYLRALYDDCILKVDFAAGELFRSLKERGLYDSALIIVTSDHGEAFGEHGRYLHGDIYEHNIHVPLLIKFPHQQFAGTRVDEMAHLMDLYPTVLDVLGMQMPEGLDGQSLLPLAQGQATKHEMLFATRGSWRAVRTDADKLIREIVNDETEYYDLSTAPRESNNRAAVQPERVSTLRGLLESFFAPAPGGWQVALYTGSDTWKLKAYAASTAKLESVRLSRSNAVERIDHVSASQWVETDIELTPQVGHDILIVKPVQGHEEVHLAITSETPFSVRLGNEILESTTALDQVLSPEDPRLQAPPPPMDHPTLPQVAIWYEAPEVTGTAAKDLSAEDIESLKALGYLDE